MRTKFALLCLMMFTLWSGDVNSAPIGGIGGSPNEPIEIDADALELDQQKQLAVFSGNVIARQGAVTLKASTMKVSYSGATKTSGGSDATKISKIIADGNVRITSAEESAVGSKGIYDVNASLITLTGGVVLTRGKSVLKGDYFEYDMKTGRSRMTSAGTPNADPAKPAGSGRVKGLFVPEKGAAQ